MMPFMPFSEAALITAFTSSTLVAREGPKVRSTAETLGVGTRMAKPVSLPFTSG